MFLTLALVLCDQRHVNLLCVIEVAAGVRDTRDLPADCAWQQRIMALVPFLAGSDRELADVASRKDIVTTTGVVEFFTLLCGEASAHANPIPNAISLSIIVM